MSAATASRRVLVVLAVAAAAVLGGAAGAQAHSTLVSTDPADGSTVAVAPAQVTLTFNEPARALGTQVLVTAPDGSTVSTGDPVIDGVTVSQAVSGSLPAGVYAVTWRVTSADGHPLEGVLSFTATGAATAGGVPSAAEPPTSTRASTPVPTPTQTSAAPEPSSALSGTASIGPVAPETGAAIEPLGTDRDADRDDGSLSAAAVAGIAAAVGVLIVAVAVLVRRRRENLRRSRSTQL